MTIIFSLMMIIIITYYYFDDDNDNNNDDHNYTHNDNKKCFDNGSNYNGIGDDDVDEITEESKSKSR